ncbi:MAG: glycosyltransferase [Cyclobacteriaceae bacterium]
MSPHYSVIIPVYNRPTEVDELLESLVKQNFQGLEVILIDDGSTLDSRSIADKYDARLPIRYFYKQNSGPGSTRNYGCEVAKSDFFIFFDSDCVLPQDYFKHLVAYQQDEIFDAYGGPDKADENFTTVQKAINYSMTSVFTTGGIRGQKQSVEKFHPRSFNMGLSRQVFEKTKGFSPMRFGEDIDLSIRIVQEGFKAVLLADCFVYHKRRTNYRQFFKQVFNSGIARINLYKRHPESLKLFHFFPAMFVLYLLLSLPHALYHQDVLVLIPVILYLLVLFADAWRMTGSGLVAFHSVIASMIQLSGYGLGFLKSIWKRMILGKGEFSDFTKNFYK